MRPFGGALFVAPATGLGTRRNGGNQIAAKKMFQGFNFLDAMPSASLCDTHDMEDGDLKTIVS